MASGSLVSASLTSSMPITVGRPRSGLAGNDEIHFRIARPSPSAGIARKSPCGGDLEVDLGRHDPLAAAVAQERLARAVDGLARRDGGEHGVVVQDGDVGHARDGNGGALRHAGTVARCR